VSQQEPSALPGPERAGAAGRSWPLAGGAVVFVALATFPPPARPPAPTLDGSWVGELNRLALHGGGFGKDVAFTYGPLGYLLFPMDLGSHLLQGALLRILVVVSLALLAWRGLRRAADYRAVALFLVSQLGAAALGLTFEYQLLLPLQLACAVALERGSVAGLAAAGTAAAALLFAKTSAGVAALSSLAAVLAAWASWRRPRALVALLAAGGAAFLAAMLLGSACFGSVRELGPWLWATWRIAGDYSVAMSWSGPVADIALAAPAMMALAAGSAWLWWRRLPGAAVALAGVGPVFLAFKHAFVRQDYQHVGLFFPFLLASLGLAALEPGGARGLRGAGLAAALVVSLGGAVAVAAAPRPELGGRSLLHLSDPGRTLVGAAGWHALWAWIPGHGLRRPYGLAAARGDRGVGLGGILGSRAVGVVPFQLSYCLEEAVACVPNPTLQTFAAFTPELDRWTAAHYLGAGAPDFLIAHLYDLDHRAVAFDTPATWSALRSGYAVAGLQPAAFLAPGSTAVLLERRARPLQRSLRPLADSHLERGVWSATPPAGGRLVARVHLQPTLLQPLARTLFRIPEVYLGLRSAEGRERVVRITPSTAALGLPLDDLADTRNQLVSLLEGSRPHWRAAAIAIDGPGLAYYGARIAVEWLEEVDP